MRARPERAFYFRLAGHLGYTVAELLARISSREITEWQIYERIYGPLGAKRDDILTAQLVATIVNVNRGKRQRARRVDDVILRWDAREPVSPNELYAKAQQINAQLGGRVQAEPED